MSSLSLQKYQDIHAIFKYGQRKIGYPQIEKYTGATDNEGMRCIHWAMLFQDDDVTQFLILVGASINAQTNNGLTPLHLSLLVESNSLKEFKKFKVDKFFSYLLGSPFTRNISYDVTSLLPSNSRQQVDISLREKFGFNAVSVANLFKAYTKSGVLVNSTGVTPVLLMDYHLTSVNFQSFSWRRHFSNAVHKTLSIQVKQGILPRHASFTNMTEPASLSEAVSLTESDNALMHVWDVAIGFPNAILTLIVLLESEKFSITREDLKYKAIMDSLPSIVHRDDFSWLSVKKHMLLTQYIQWNSVRYTDRTGDRDTLLDYVQYLFVFLDVKLSTVKYGVMKETLDSLLYWTIAILVSVWYQGSSLNESAHFKSVIEYLQELSLKYKLSLYHFLLSNDMKLVRNNDPIKFLLENGFNCNVRTEESSGLSVLNFAYNKQDMESCLLLLKYGAYPLSVDRFNMSFVDQVVKCPTALPFTIVKKNKVRDSNALIRGISKDPVLKEIWVKFSRLPYTLLTLTAQSIVRQNIAYGSLAGKMVAFIQLHDPAKPECHNSPVS